MASRRLLLSLAHPDDESFGYGALISKYVAEGVDVYLIVSTNGDVGTILPEFMEGYNSIAERRLAELDCANEILKFKQIFRLGYKDSGMMGSETSKDPACSWQAPQEELAGKVVEIIREIKPQVVITFNKFGGYGHPDHIAIQRATTDAVMLAGDANYDTGGQAPYQPQNCITRHTPNCGCNTIFFKHACAVMIHANWGATKTLTWLLSWTTLSHRMRGSAFTTILTSGKLPARAMPANWVAAEVNRPAGSAACS